MNVGNPGVSPEVPVPVPWENLYLCLGYRFPTGLAVGQKNIIAHWQI
jgi:hypothetical protein